MHRNSRPRRCSPPRRSIDPWQRYRRLRIELLERRRLLNGDLPNPHGLFPGEQFSVYTDPADPEYVAEPYGVAVGDLNGDGQLDLVTVNYSGSPDGHGTVSVLLGYGTGAFADYVAYPVASSPEAVTLADVTADGVLDIVVTDSDDNSVSQLPGAGDGTFGARQVIGSVGSYPTDVWVGDLDADGDPDIVTANLSGDSVTVLRGSGGGTFAAEPDYPVGDGPWSLDLGDLDGDGLLDIATANQRDATVSVLFGDATDGFLDEQVYGVAASPRSVAIGEVSGDGLPDIVTVGYPAIDVGNVSVLLGSGSRGFVAADSMTTGGGMIDVAVSDLDGDGNGDIVALSYGADFVIAYPSNGDGTFAASEKVYAGDTPHGLALGDVNGDGQTDAITANAYANTVSVLLGLADGSFQSVELNALAQNPMALALGDMNNDGHLDFATANSSLDAFSIGLGLGDGTFAAATTYPSAANPRDNVALGDLNGDGHLDLVAPIGSNLISVRLGTGDGDGTLQDGQYEVTYTTVDSPASVRLGDVTGDGILDIVALDIVVVEEGKWGLIVLEGSGDGTFTVLGTQDVLGCDANSLILADVDADGDLDFLAAGDYLSSHVVSVVRNTGSGTFSSPQRYTVGENARALVAGDLNGDGAVDVAVIADVTEEIYVLLGNLDASNQPDGTFAAATAFASGHAQGPYEIAIGEVNGDGFPDIVAIGRSVVNGDFTTAAVFLGRGDGTFSGPAVYGNGHGFGYDALQLADLDHDGHLDIVTANASDLAVAVLRGLGSSANVEPVANPDSGATNEDAPLVIDVLANDTDDNGDGLTVSGVDSTSAEGAAVAIQADDTIRYDPTVSPTLRALANGQTLDDTFEYTISDGRGGFATGTVTVTVTGIPNTPPEADDDTAATDEDTRLIIHVLGNDSDPDGDPLSVIGADDFSTEGAPITVHADGTLTYNPRVAVTLQDLAAGATLQDTFQYTLSDGEGGTDTAVVTVTVTGVDEPPQADPHRLFPGEEFGVFGDTFSMLVEDLNGDGILDAVTTPTLNNAVSVLLGSGDGRFTEPGIFFVDSKPYGLAAGDLNGDGIPDLVTGSFATGQLSVLLGNGDGTFASQVTYSAGGGIYSVVLADLNGDGKLDAATANSADDSVSVLLGNGDGSFAAQQPFATGDEPVTVAAGDLDGDGVADLVTANRSAGSFSVLQNNGDGTFAAPTAWTVGNAPSHLVLGDTDADGLLDVVTTNTDDHTVSVRRGNADGTFGSAITYPVGTQPTWVELRDMNQDGRVDLLTADAGDGSLTLLFGMPDGTYGDLKTYYGGAVWSYDTRLTVAAGDVNGDGLLDAITTDAAGSICVLLGNWDGSLASQRQYAAGSSPRPVLGDLNDDGALDIVAANSGWNDVSVLLGVGDGTFAAQTKYTVQLWPNAVTLGDLNGDGQLDLVAANSSDDTVSVRLGQGDGSFTAQTTFAVGDHPRYLALGDLNGDSVLDLVSANGWDDSVSVLLGQGDGTFASQVTYASGSEDPVRVRLGDLDQDGDLDVVVVNIAATDAVSVLRNAGDGTLSQPELSAGGCLPTDGALGDLDDDGLLDLVTISFNQRSAAVRLGNGDGTFTAPIHHNFPDGCQYLDLLDVDRDGTLDLLTSQIGGISVRLGNGMGMFGSIASYAAAGGVPVTGDLNGDLFADVVTGAGVYGDSFVSVLLALPDVPGNSPPTAKPDTAATDEVSPITVDVLANDEDTDGDAIRVTGADALSELGAQVTLLADGQIHYDPSISATLDALAEGATVDDTVRYGITDDRGGVAAGTLTVTVTGVNDPPIARDDTVNADEDTPLTIAVLDNDSDIDGDDLSVSSADTTSAEGAAVTINADGSLRYDPRGSASLNALAEGAVQQDLVHYTISDGHGGTDAGTITLTVEGRNDRPVAWDDQSATDEDTPLDVAVLTNDQDVDGDTLHLVSADPNSALGAAVTVNANGTLHYDPVSSATLQATPPGGTVQDTVTYTIDDGHGGTSSGILTVTVTGLNESPQAEDDLASTDEDTAINIDVLSNDTDFEDDPLQVTQADAQSARGAVVEVNADHTIRYDPTVSLALQALGVGQSLEDTFEYTISDGQGGSSAGTVTVTVTGVNDPPTADPDTGTTDADTAIDVAVLDNDDDVDGDALSVSSADAASPLGATVTVNADGSLRYDPTTSTILAALASGHTVEDTLTYTVSDGQGGTDMATVTITVAGIADPPNPHGLFAEEQQRADSAGATDLLCQDVNADGIPDVVVTHLSSDKVSILLGQGDGSLGAAQVVAAGDQPWSVAAGDLDGDGKIDLVVPNHRSQAVRVLRGNGDGTFSTPTVIDTGASPQGVAVGDVNADGNPDIVATLFDSGKLAVLLGTGGGGFSAYVHYDAGPEPQGVAVGDLNGDGAPDIVVANYYSWDVSVLLGNLDGLNQPDGTFARPVPYGSSAERQRVVIEDLNGDGAPEILAVGGDIGSTVSVLMGAGDGTFVPSSPATYPVGNSARSLALADLNNDGNADLVTPDFGLRTLSVRHGAGDGTFGEAATHAMGGAATAIALEDLDADGNVDVILGNASDPSVSVIRGMGVGGLLVQQQYAMGIGPMGLALGDFDSDGNPDLVTADSEDDTISLRLGVGDGTLGERVAYSVGDDPQAVAVADLDGDGTLDVVTADQVSMRLSTLPGQGDGTFVAVISSPLPIRPAYVALGNMDGDDFPDAVTANGTANSVSVLLGQGDGSFAYSDPQTYTVGTSPGVVALGDLNGDGDTDVVVANSDSSNITVLFGQGDGTLVDAAEYGSLFWRYVRHVAVGDLNGDGAPEIVVTYAGDSPYLEGGVAILTNQRDGTFSLSSSLVVGRNPYGVTVGDVDGSGTPDLLVANANFNDVALLLGYGDGTFAAAAFYGAGDITRAAALGDLNGDGRQDIVTANNCEDSVSVLLNGTGIGVDTDTDGIEDAVENGAPNGGDGNQDGVLDSQQDHVASLPNAIDGQYVTLAAPAGTALVDVTAGPVPADLPPGVSLPCGMLDFAVESIPVGGAFVVDVMVPSGMTFDTYYKYGPTPADPTPHGYEFAFDGTTGAEILTDRVRLHFVDGQRGDDDLTADGRFVEPGGPVLYVTVADPGFSYVDANNDGLFLAADGDVPLTAGEVADGYFDTRRPEGPKYRTALPGAGLVIAQPRDELVARDVRFFADGNLVVRTDLTARRPRGRVQLVSRTGDVAVPDGIRLKGYRTTVYAKNNVQAAGSVIIARYRVNVAAGQSIDLQSAVMRASMAGRGRLHVAAWGGDLDLAGGQLSGRRVLLSAAGAMHAQAAQIIAPKRFAASAELDLDFSEASVRRWEQASLWSKSGNVILVDTRSIGKVVKRSWLQVNAAGSIELTNATLAAYRVRVAATDQVFAESARLLACGTGDTRVSILARGAADVDLTNAIVRARGRISINAQEGAVDLVMASLGITGGRRGDIWINGQWIDIEQATILAPDRIWMSVVPDGTPLELGRGILKCP